MGNDFTPVQTNTLNTAIEAPPPCGERAARALCQRVASLRAALDALRGALPTSDPLQGPVHGALTELDRLARDVRALVDWSLPGPLRPLECSLEEIGLAAVDALHPDRRSRTLVAVERPATRVYLDGTLASTSLARWIEHGFATGADSAGLKLEPGDAGFTAIASFDGVGEGLGETQPSVAAGLSDALARRDIGRMGARLDVDAAGRRAVFAFVASEARTGGTR